MDNTVIDKLAGRKAILSVSGGKDSAATSLYLRELGIEHVRVFADTGWEHEFTYEYLRGPLSEALGIIHEVRGERTMDELVTHKGAFPSRVMRFCTTELKIKPLAAFVKSFGDDVVNVVGIRAAESAARAKMPEWEYSDAFDCDVWRPIIRWTEQDVIDIHKRHGLAPNPLYLRGAERVGCWPCINSRKDEIRRVADTDPARIERIRRLEMVVGDAAEARAIRNNTTLEEKGHHRPTFFHGRGATMDMIPIDQVVRWSRTNRNGSTRSEELFHDFNDGCARWGMCEQAAKR